MNEPSQRTREAVLDGEPSSAPRRSRFRRWLGGALPRAVAWLVAGFYGLVSDQRGWRPLLARVSAHLAIIVLAVAAIGLSSVDWPAQAAAPLSLSAASGAAGDRTSLAASSADTIQSAERDASAPRSGNSGIGSAVGRLAQPHTIIPTRPRLDVITYTVQAGDTIEAIAAAFRLEPTSIMWSNPEVEDAPDLLRIGQKLLILPVDGVYHTVAPSDTLRSIAEAFQVSPEAIAQCEYNHLQPPDQAIEQGMHLIVPGGQKPYVTKVVTAYDGPIPEGFQGSGQFMWPVLGYITQGYWYGHRAIDIAAPIGSALLAADAGFVSFAGWTDVGYGYLVVINHQNSFVTYYGHMSNIYVYEGQAVARGQVIGAVGSTGRSTGPHLHFEVRYGGVQQNPRAYLP